MQIEYGYIEIWRVKKTLFALKCVLYQLANENKNNCHVAFKTELENNTESEKKAKQNNGDDDDANSCWRLKQKLFFFYLSVSVFNSCM